MSASLRRIGIISDVHAEDTFLEMALHFLQAQAVDRILCAGDIADGPGDENRCCELLKQYDVAVVRGNHDRWILDNTMRDLPDATPLVCLSAETQAYLANLPPTLTFETVAGKLLLNHGIGENDMAQLAPDTSALTLALSPDFQQVLADGYRFVIGGHTHRRMVRNIGETVFINPGALYYKHSPGFALADFAQSELQFFDIKEGEIHPSEAVSL